MNKTDKKEYLKYLNKQIKKAKNIIIEKPEEIVDPILGLELYEFEILTGKQAYCADEEIFLDFQGKEMRIYINDEGKLSVYTD